MAAGLTDSAAFVHNHHSSPLSYYPMTRPLHRVICVVSSHPGPSSFTFTSAHSCTEGP